MATLALLALRPRLKTASSSSVKKRLQQLLFPELRPAETYLTFSALSFPADRRWCSTSRCRTRSSRYTVAHEGQCQRAQLPGSIFSGSFIGYLLKLLLCSPSQSRIRSTAPLPREPLAKRESFTKCQGLSSLGATTTTAASGGNRESLLEPRPARRKQKRCGCWVPQPGSGIAKQ